MVFTRPIALAAAAWLAASDLAAAADLDRSMVITRDPAPATAGVPTPITHGGLQSFGPNCDQYAYGDRTGSIWLGHFAGGNVGPLGPVTGGVDWRDVYACFPSRKTCQAWQRDLRHVFRRLQGWRTCLLIR